MAQTPLELLTVIAAPALITNASSILVLSTTNRFARAVDRSRLLIGELAKQQADHPARIGLLQMHLLMRRRTEILVRAMTAFYLAVGSFAFGTFAGLLGQGLGHIGLAGLEPYFTAVALIVVTIGTLAIAAGAALLVVETRLGLKGLSIEAAQQADKYAR